VDERTDSVGVEMSADIEEEEEEVDSTIAVLCLKESGGEARRRLNERDIGEAGAEIEVAGVAEGVDGGSIELFSSLTRSMC
jgi:hypothetical protein